jgi:transcriptional antiterminator NusG
MFAKSDLKVNDQNGLVFVKKDNSGFEKTAKTALEERVKSKKLEALFGEVLIPSENVVEMVKGKKRTTNKRFFPGYILVKMILNDDTWHVVKNTPKITGFVGGKIKPPAIPEKEVFKLTRRIAEGELRPKSRMSFEKGESVRVTEGPFVNFNGMVDEVKPEKGKLRVLVSIFGRSTPVELDFSQVEKN